MFNQNELFWHALAILISQKYQKNLLFVTFVSVYYDFFFSKWTYSTIVQVPMWRLIEIIIGINHSFAIKNNLSEVTVWHQDFPIAFNKKLLFWPGSLDTICVCVNITNAIQFIFCSDTELGPLLLEVHLNCLIAQFSYAAMLLSFLSLSCYTTFKLNPVWSCCFCAMTQLSFIPYIFT